MAWQDPIGDMSEWARRIAAAPPTRARTATMTVHFSLARRYGRSAVMQEAHRQAQLLGFAGGRVVWVGAPVPSKPSKRRYGK